MPSLDFNLMVCGLLDDMAAMQPSIYARRAYERSARSVALLPDPIPDIPPNALAAWPHLGRSAMRVVNEALASGDSATVRQATGGSGRGADVVRRQALREGFLSMARAIATRCF